MADNFMIDPTDYDGLKRLGVLVRSFRKALMRGLDEEGIALESPLQELPLTQEQEKKKAEIKRTKRLADTFGGGFREGSAEGTAQSVALYGLVEMLRTDLEAEVIQSNELYGPGDELPMEEFVPAGIKYDDKAKSLLGKYGMKTILKASL